MYVGKYTILFGIKTNESIVDSFLHHNPVHTHRFLTTRRSELMHIIIK